MLEVDAEAQQRPGGMLAYSGQMTEHSNGQAVKPKACQLSIDDDIW
jgi:hypothetical protein